jgi:hypothetical protein
MTPWRKGQSLLALGALACLILALGDAGPTQAASVTEIGPLYTPGVIAGKTVAGVSLGMSVKAAEAVLTASGFERRFTNPSTDCQYGCATDGNIQFFTKRDGEHVGIGYVGAAQSSSVVSSISYQEPASDADTGADTWRQSILSRYGPPSVSSMRMFDGHIRDQLAYVVSSDLRDEYERDTLSACGGGAWVQMKIWRHVDCRLKLSRHQEPMLTISFGWQTVWYELTDYSTAYRYLNKNKRFRSFDTRGVNLPTPTVH